MKPSNESQPRYGIRKFTVGVDSAVIGSVLFLTPTVQATESLSHAPAVPAQVKDRSAGMEKEKPIQKKEDKAIPQGVQPADTPQLQKDLAKKKTTKEPDKEIPSSVPHKEGGKEDSKNTMEVASPAQESQAGKPKPLPKTGAEAEMISLGVCLLVGGLSVIFNPFKRNKK